MFHISKFTRLRLSEKTSFPRPWRGRLAAEPFNVFNGKRLAAFALFDGKGESCARAVSQSLPLRRLSGMETASSAEALSSEGGAVRRVRKLYHIALCDARGEMEAPPTVSRNRALSCITTRLHGQSPHFRPEDRVLRKTYTRISHNRKRQTTMLGPLFLLLPPYFPAQFFPAAVPAAQSLDMPYIFFYFEQI